MSSPKKTLLGGKVSPMALHCGENLNHRVKKAMKADCPGCNCVYL